jgi:hypothetical protein
MKKMLVAAAFAVGVAASPPAQARDFAEVYTQCGLGGLIAGSIPWLAVITNITWDLGTTAITSNVSSPETCKGVAAKTAAFINDAAPRIEQDLARGQGPYLAALLELSGCQSSSQAAVTSALRTDLGATLASPGAASRSGYQQAASLYQLYTSRLQSDFTGVCTAG